MKQLVFRGVRTSMPEQRARSGASMQRLFFAARPPTATRARLAALAEHLAPTFPARWIRPARYHLTLCFIGSETRFSPARIDRVLRAADCVQAPALLWRPDRVSGFRARRPPCVLGESAPDPALRHLHRQLCEALAMHEVRVADRRRYVPHVTLGYGHGAVIERRSIEAVDFPIDSFVLLHSVPGEADYRELGRWDLRVE